VKGWSRPEVIALSGLFQIVTGLMDTFIMSNTSRFTGLVANGELDPVLLRPMSSQFYTMFRWISPSSFFSAIAGLLIMMFGLRLADASPGPIEIVAAAVITICGTVLLTCFCSAMIYLVFWSTSVHSISTLFTDLWYAGGYPTVFFPSGIRVFLTVVFPVAFATTVPMETLLGRSSGSQVVFALVATAVAILLIRTWWRFAVTFYSSASS
jgi:ABC-2 type transport system permease protein